MSRQAFIIAALAIVAVAVLSGGGGRILSSVERGFGYGIGHEVAHGLFHGEARR